MHLPRPTTVTEKYLAAIHEQLYKLNQSDQPGVETETKPGKNPSSETSTDLQGINRHKCDICGKTFKTNGSLRAHKSRQHGRNV